MTELLTACNVRRRVKIMDVGAISIGRIKFIIT